MAKFSDAFLQGLRGSGQRGSPTDPALQRADQYGSSNPLAKSLGGMLGMQMDTGQELASKEMKQIDQQAPDALLQSLAVQAKYEQDPQRQVAILSKMSELKNAVAAKRDAAVKESAVKTQRAKQLAALAKAVRPTNPLLADQIETGDELAAKSGAELLGRAPEKASADWKSLGGDSNSLFNARTGEIKKGVAGVDPEKAPITAEAQEALLNIARNMPGASAPDVIAGVREGLASGVLQTLSDVKNAVPKPAEETSGALPASLEKDVAKNNETYARSVSSVNQADFVLNAIAADPTLLNAKSGWLAQATTYSKDALGLRDSLSFMRTNATAAINKDLVFSLPPGIASDRDIELFKMGFPSEDAGVAEIQEYLRASKRIHQIVGQRSRLYDNFVGDNVAQGRPTAQGFIRHQQHYDKAVLTLQNKLNRAEKEGTLTSEMLNKEREDFSAATDGVIPTHIFDKYL